MTLLAKNYILFYLDPAHRHPSIPEWTNYNAVDDARIFQKYVWAGVDSTLKLWKPALESTKNQIVTYNNNLAFLAYFSCSAGFTWSAKEKRWLQDTPYLTSVYDPAPCKDFNGHGVWLAGNGATALAKDGKTYEQIIQYFYPGVTIQTY
jgi:SpoIID/LytB domain protein